MGGDHCVVDRSFELLVMYPTYELFAEGFTHKPGQDYVSFAAMVQRRTSRSCSVLPWLSACQRCLQRNGSTRSESSAPT